MRFANYLPSLCIAAVLATSGSVSAQTVQKKAESSSTPVGTFTWQGGVFHAAPSASPFRAPRATTATPLTANECTNLGGEVHILSICKSGKVCNRKDEDGKTRQVCISKT